MLKFLQWSLMVVAASLVGCAAERPPAAVVARITPEQALRALDRAIPPGTVDRQGWVTDLYRGFTALGLEPTPQSICAVAAVIEQESGFVVDPIVPGLAAIARREIDQRTEHAGIPPLLVRGVLRLPSSNGRTYEERIEAARTERELSDIFEDFIGRVPLGRALFEDRNPIRTRGPMQVHVHFAEEFAEHHPYPYPVRSSIADEVFTRRGGLYFGIAHLLDYAAPYDRFLFRFADFNAGQYASRNAAFQHALSVVSGIRLTADGTLLPPDGAGPGATEVAARRVGPRLKLDEEAVHLALQTSKTAQFAETPLYVGVFALAQRAGHGPATTAQIPTIQLRGPKITRTLTTAWYANRVNGRFERCLKP